MHRSGITQRIICGAHREGVQLKIVPSTRRATREAQTASEPSESSLRAELIRIFQNLTDLQDNSLFINIPDEEQRHNNLTPLSSPLFFPSDLPSSPQELLPDYSPSDPLVPTSEINLLSAPSAQQSSYVSISDSMSSALSVSILSEEPSP
jgi:hypothetical protein